MTRTQADHRTFELETAQATTRLGARLAPLFKPADIVFLIGDLGMGKTTFAQGVIEKITGKSKDVTSPTYNLVHVWDGESFDIWHVDLYRLAGPQQVSELGLEDAFSRHLTLIEWPDRLGALAPDDRLDIIFKKTDMGRTVTLRPMGKIWEARLHGF